MSPSILLIVADDQRWDSISQMPALDARTDLARYEHVVVHLPQCAPSRASIHTGLYAHHTLVEANTDFEDLDESETLAVWLSDAGYRCGLFGKYSNGYPFGRGNYTPAGWDDWAAFTGAHRYFDYTLIENGTQVAYGTAEADYSTDVLAQKARDFIADTPPGQPFFCVFVPVAPHDVDPGNAQPAPRHEGTVTSVAPHRPNFNGVDTVSEPAWMASANNKSDSGMTQQRTDTAETLLALDEAIEALLGDVDASGRDVYVIVTSDNAYMFGEHRLTGKGALYEESIRVPLSVRGPGITPGVYDRPAANVDIAPTICEWAGVTPGLTPDGVPLSADRNGILLRGVRTDALDGSNFGNNAWGWRTLDYKFVVYEDTDERQLFDLLSDPYELTNLADNPAYAAVVADLEAQMTAERGF